ncbi:diphthamide biosynthesis protein 3 [Tieghemostelium lacteum]|uniref:Diphthamide biosynthesis protein 3 n=1 Tax=Tieghemostelium lacteum TaxID=361077 RepID=A0A151Z5P3_TIELA|nr:diphthamide biosynthesis protein 3 [Tieghemostelium lacteum]|eukprot:KYQ89265.1 diphthamide biosynthesis protein 3 [Tieghemostelium lacteum]
MSTAEVENTPTPEPPKTEGITFVKDDKDIDFNKASFYDEIEIEDMEFNEDERVFYYPCPCGDRFRITEEEILQGEEIAICPSCSLLLKVVYSPEDFVIEEEKEDE